MFYSFPTEAAQQPCSGGAMVQNDGNRAGKMLAQSIG